MGYAMDTPRRATSGPQVILAAIENAQRLAAVTAALGEAYTVVSCSPGVAPNRRQELHPLVIILDADSDTPDFIGICRRLRSRSSAAIVVLGAGGDELATAQALDAGADDVVGVPFAEGELQARVRALLRRSAPIVDAERTVAGPLTIDDAQHRASLDGRELPLSVTEFSILTLLARHRNRVVTREDILSYVWGADRVETHRLLHVAMNRLRGKLGGGNRTDIAIDTVAGVGYRLLAKPAPADHLA